ncbi:MAG TPA: AAA family ATPase [Phycisphaerae bacterium]|nr:AAA family ATPase [Phycisphaerae bacterium]
MLTEPQAPEPLLPDSGRPYLRHVRIRNYRSIGKCAVELGALTVLVGRNAAGKSNFLDALRFVVDGLRTSLDHAVKARGGIDAVRRKSTGHPRNFAIEFDLLLPCHQTGTYGFEIAARRQGAFVVNHEQLVIRDAGGQSVAHYNVGEGSLVSASRKDMPPVAADRLYLVTAASLPEFRPVYETLLAMGFYNLNPDAMKELQSPDAGEILHRDGDNIPSVIARLSADNPDAYARIKQYLQAIVPGITEVVRVTLGPRETLEFRQRVQGSGHAWKFYAANMPDGTLRALGALVSVAQLADHRSPVSLIGIEEPETALHPAAAGALMDALREAAQHTKIVAASHNPDLLDQVNPATDVLLVVVSREGRTEIAPLDRASAAAIKDHLYSPGELLRQDQLAPDEQSLALQRQLRLFDVEDDA